MTDENEISEVQDAVKVGTRMAAAMAVQAHHGKHGDGHGLTLTDWSLTTAGILRFVTTLSAENAKLKEELAARDARIVELEALDKKRREGDLNKKDWCLCGAGKGKGLGEINPHTLACQADYHPKHPHLIPPRKALSESEGA